MDIDRSLDEIIKQNRTSKGKPKQNGGPPPGRGGKGGRGRGGGRGGGRVANGRNAAFQNGDSYKKLANGMKTKAAKKPVRRLESVSTGRKIHKAVAPIQGSGTLQVSNLHFNVSDSDVRDLFGEVGKIKKSHLHYDQSGRSLGTADVTYERRSDAIKAMKQYNGVPLDGKAMKIEVAAAAAQADFGGQIRSHLGIKPSGMKFNYKNVVNGGGIVKKKVGKVGGRGGKMVGGGRGGKMVGGGNVKGAGKKVGGGSVRGGVKIRGGGKGRGGGKLTEGGKVNAGANKGLKKKVPKEVKKAPTAEELDKEMDEYQNGRS